MIKANQNLAFGYAFAQFKIEKKKFYHVTLGYQKNKLLAIGVNKLKRHPKLDKLGYSNISRIHSELDLLIKLSNQNVKLDEIDIVNFCFSYRTLEKQINKHRQSKPCKYCSAWVFDTFKSVTYFDKKWKTI